MQSIIWAYNCPSCHNPKYCKAPDSDLCYKCLSPFICNCRFRFKNKELLEEHKKNTCANRDIKIKVSKPIPIPEKKYIHSKYVDRSTIKCICGSTVQTNFLSRHRDTSIHYQKLNWLARGRVAYWQ